MVFVCVCVCVFVCVCVCVDVCVCRCVCGCVLLTFVFILDYDTIIPNKLFNPQPDEWYEISSQTTTHSLFANLEFIEAINDESEHVEPIPNPLLEIIAVRFLCIIYAFILY
jgi:hypothetical protein